MMKSNGLKGNGYWYVAYSYADGTFTMTTNRANALTFDRESNADSFNQRQLKLGHISAPFELTEI